MLLAQRLRPKLWSDYHGSENYVKILHKSILNNNVPGALFISGPSGVGKTELATLYIKSILCLNRKDNEVEPCNNCVNCNTDPRTTGVENNVLWVQSGGGTGDTINSQMNDLVQEAYIPAQRFSLTKSPRKFLVIDECFPSDVEILTDKGFIKFDSLDKSELVAQFNLNNEEISFTKPLRYIEKEYEGNLINFKKHKSLSLSVTPNHDLIVFNTFNNSYVKDTALNTTLTYYTYFKTCGFTSSAIKTNLNYLDKFMIMYQADGCFGHTSLNGDQSAVFSFSKQRKIDKFLQLMKEGSFTFTERAETEAKGNKKKQRTFYVKELNNLTKDLSKHFNITELSLSVCKQIIEEMICWDGHITSSGTYYYSSTLKANADFYQTVALLCNYHTNQITQVDNRSEAFNDVYRLYVVKNKNKVTGQYVDKTETHYSGKVYCVEVPTGNIVVRHNGKVVITGNCQNVPKDKLSQLLFLSEVSKVSEENNVTFIIMTMDEQSINDNVLLALKSRCGAFYFKFKTPTLNDLKQFIIERFILDDDVINTIALYSNHSYRAVLQTIEYCIESCPSIDNKSINSLLGFADKDIRRRLWQLLESCNRQGLQNYRAFKTFWDTLEQSIDKDILYIQLEQDIELSLLSKPNEAQLIALDALYISKVNKDISLLQTMRSLMGLKIIDFDIFK